MPDYTHSKIYKLVCNTTGKIYIGSTTTSLTQRLYGHIKMYRDFKRGKTKKIVASYEIIENENFEIIEILSLHCNHGIELLKKEQEVLDNHPEAVNINRAYRTPEEKREYHRQYDKKRQYTEEQREAGRNYKRRVRLYAKSWDGLLKIDTTLFS